MYTDAHYCSNIDSPFLESQGLKSTGYCCGTLDQAGLVENTDMHPLCYGIPEFAYRCSNEHYLESSSYSENIVGKALVGRQTHDASSKYRSYLRYA